MMKQCYIRLVDFTKVKNKVKIIGKQPEAHKALELIEVDDLNSDSHKDWIREVEMGELVVKLEYDKESESEENYEESESDGDESGDECSTATSSSKPESLFRYKQLRAMSKYSSQIANDLKNKVKKLVDGQFSCRICGVTNSYRQGLQGHLSTHRDGNPFRCPLENCSKLFPTHPRLNRHIELHFPPTKVYRCNHPACKARFRTRFKLNDHKFTHSEVKQFACSILGCGKRFTLRGALKRHLQTHLNHEEREKHECDECGLKFISKVGYFQHVQRHKGIQKKKNFSCNFCGARFESFYAIEVHIRSHTKERPFQCKECKMWLASESGLQSHGRVHKKTDPFLCPQCPKQFKWKTDLETHQKEMHDENAEIFQCHECSYRTVRAKDLKRHKNRIHVKLRPHSCPLCPKVFAEKQGLRIHIDMHGTERPFKCKDCDQGFVTSSKLKLHSQTHSEEMKFPCPECDNKYKSYVGRAMHLKHIHGIGDEKKWTRNHSCYFCNKIYQGYSGHLKHLRRHTRERPYRCQEPNCSSTWVSSAENLTYHLLIKHGKGKPYNVRKDTDERFQCPKCPRNYKYKGDLSKHDKTSHDEFAPVYKCSETGCAYETKHNKVLRRHVRDVHRKKC